MLKRALQKFTFVLQEVKILGCAEAGATMLEYAMIAASIAVVAIASVTLVGRETNRSYKNAGSEICYQTYKEENPALFAPRPPGGAEGEAPGQHCYD